MKWKRQLKKLMETLWSDSQDGRKAVECLKCLNITFFISNEYQFYNITQILPWVIVILPILFSNIINDPDDGIQPTLSDFTDDTILERVADAPDWCPVIQEDLKWLEKWTKSFRDQQW